MGRLQIATIKTKIKEKGFVLPLIFIVTALVVSIVVYVIGSSITNHQSASKENSRANAQLAADAGLDKALEELTANTTWTGTGQEVELYNNTSMRTTYEVSVLDGSVANRKTVRSIGRTYIPASSTTPSSTRKYELDADAVTSGNGPSSVVTGVGGLILSANAKISGGDVIVNGKITMSNNSQIGLSTNPVNVRVAHQSCPIPVTSAYPQVCGSGNGQPITMGNTAKIYGNVQATNQTTGTNMTNPGLIPNSTFAPVSLPAFDRSGMKSTINNSEQTMTGAQASNCPVGGSVTWPANVKINGNVVIKVNCTVKIYGNAWITGGVDISNNANLVVQDSVGTNQPVLMIDGRVSSGVNGGSPGFGLSNNGKITPNASGTGVEVITFWSAASCSPDCATVTGPDLANSQGVMTIDLGNNGSAQNSVFYSYWSLVQVSNNGALGAVAGQTVSLSNNAVISFTTSIPGSSNQITTWVKRGYIRVF